MKVFFPFFFVKLPTYTTNTILNASSIKIRAGIRPTEKTLRDRKISENAIAIAPYVHSQLPKNFVVLHGWECGMT
jgi:hypothetical protein